MASITARLRRLREAVAATQLPELQRGTPRQIATAQDVEHAVNEANRSGAGAQEKARIVEAATRIGAADKIPDAWKTREATRLQVVIREADIKRNGAAFDATIIREGPGNPEDKNAYTREALRKAVSDGLFEGLKCYSNHQTPTEERERPERDIRQLVGHFREARYLEDGGVGRVRAKFIPISGPGYEWITSLIESALGSVPGRPLIGISIDGYGHTPDTKDINGRTYHMVREIAVLGSADIVTATATGGEFHRRCREAWRSTTPAERPVETSKEATMKIAKLQEQIKAAAAKLDEAAGLKDDDEKGQTLVDEALTSLRECAVAEIEPEVRIQEKIVEKTLPASTEEKDQLAVKLREAEVKLAEAEVERKAEKQRRKDAEGNLATIERGRLAAKVIRESGVPEKTGRDWFDEVADLEDEPAMKQLVERKKAARDELLAELRESYGIEGAGPRQPTLTGGTPSGGLLDRMGIDKDELAAA